MSKVKLPKEVADAIEKAREDYYDFEVIEHICDTSVCHSPMMPIAEYVWRDGESHPIEMQKIMSALVNGYEIEKTPEEQVKELYYRASIGATRKDVQKYYDSGVMLGIEETLKYFGI